MSPALVFLKDNHSYLGNVHRQSVIRSQGAKIEAKNTWRTTITTTTTTGRMQDLYAIYQNVFISTAQLGPGTKGAQQ